MYTEKVYGKRPAGALTALDLTAAANSVYLEDYLSQVNVKRIAIGIKTTVVSTGTVVVKFFDRPLPGSDAGRVLIGTLNIPAGTAAGSVVYKDVTNYTIVPGHEVVAAVTTASAGGGAAGAGFEYVEAEDDPEAVLDQPTMIASA